jgi:hypothetical protein
MLPPCGCRGTCFHAQHPDLEQYRQCRLEPTERRPAVRAELMTPVQDAFDAMLARAIERANARAEARTPEQLARTRWASWARLRVSVHAPGVGRGWPGELQ